MEFYGMTGEKLGVIGQIDGTKSKFDDLPQWKKDLLQKPSISVRKGIAWVRLYLLTASYGDSDGCMLAMIEQEKGFIGALMSLEGRSGVRYYAPA